MQPMPIVTAHRFRFQPAISVCQSSQMRNHLHQMELPRFLISGRCKDQRTGKCWRLEQLPLPFAVVAWHFQQLASCPSYHWLLWHHDNARSESAQCMRAAIALGLVVACVSYFYSYAALRHGDASRTEDFTTSRYGGRIQSRPTSNHAQMDPGQPVDDRYRPFGPVYFSFLECYELRDGKLVPFARLRSFPMQKEQQRLQITKHDYEMKISKEMLSKR